MIPDPAKPARLTPEQQQLVADNLGLAQTTAAKVAHAVSCRMSRFGGSKKLFEQFFPDLAQEGYLGLCGASRLFDPSFGFKFSTYAFVAAKNRIQRAIVTLYSLRPGVAPTTKKFTKNVPLLTFSQLHTRVDSEQEDVSWLIWDESYQHEPPPPIDLTPEMETLLCLALNPRQARFVKEHIVDGRTLQDLGKEWKLSRERVRQIIANALTSLRRQPAFIKALRAQTERARRMRQEDFSGTGVCFKIA